MRNRLIAGNWKLNGSVELCEQFKRGLADLNTSATSASILICPPAVYLENMALSSASTGWKVGAQNVSEHESGAFTGEISAPMIAECGATHCIVGHSERRSLFAETDEIVFAKTERLLSAGITPILCVGESLAVREQGHAESFVAEQLRAVFSGIEADAATGIVVAYEPVWAIGTGMSASAEQAQKMHESIRSVLSEYTNAQISSILYGGSVKADNAEELLALPDVDGALVGGASLDLEQFLAIAGVK